MEKTTYYCRIYDVSGSVAKIALEQYLIYQGQSGRLCRILDIRECLYAWRDR